MCNKTKCFAKNKILLSYFTEAVLLNKIVHLFVNLYQIIIQKNQSQSGQFVLAINWPFFGYVQCLTYIICTLRSNGNISAKAARLG